MKIREFEYDLWTTNDDGTKKYWVRIRLTGEVSEISHELIKVLRGEEKRLYRQIEVGNTELSLDTPCDEERESWYGDHFQGGQCMALDLEEKEFRTYLTTKQLDVNMKCIRGGSSAVTYAKEHGITKQSVFDIVTAIRKKAKKYFIDT